MRPKSRSLRRCALCATDVARPEWIAQTKAQFNLVCGSSIRMVQRCRPPFLSRSDRSRQRAKNRVSARAKAQAPVGRGAISDLSTVARSPGLPGLGRARVYSLPPSARVGRSPNRNPSLRAPWGAASPVPTKVARARCRRSRPRESPTECWPESFITSSVWVETYTL